MAIMQPEYDHSVREDRAGNGCGAGCDFATFFGFALAFFSEPLRCCFLGSSTAFTGEAARFGPLPRRDPRLLLLPPLLLLRILRILQTVMLPKLLSLLLLLLLLQLLMLLMLRLLMLVFL